MTWSPIQQPSSPVLTSDLVSVGIGVNVLLVGDILEADELDKLMNLVKTELAIEHEEHLALLDGEGRVGGEVPDVDQVLVVHNKEGIPG